MLQRQFLNVKCIWIYSSALRNVKYICLPVDRSGSSCHTDTDWHVPSPYGYNTSTGDDWFLIILTQTAPGPIVCLMPVSGVKTEFIVEGCYS